jgi:hypothetical protein
MTKQEKNLVTHLGRNFWINDWSKSHWTFSFVFELDDIMFRRDFKISCRMAIGSQRAFFKKLLWFLDSSDVLFMSLSRLFYDIATTFRIAAVLNGKMSRLFWGFWQNKCHSVTKNTVIYCFGKQKVTSFSMLYLCNWYFFVPCIWSAILRLIRESEGCERQRNKNQSTDS